MNLPEGASLFRSTGLYVDRSGALVPVPKNFEGPFPFFPEGTTTRGWMTVMTGRWEIFLTQNPKTQSSMQPRCKQVKLGTRNFPVVHHGFPRQNFGNLSWRSLWWWNLLTQHEVLTIHLQSDTCFLRSGKAMKTWGASCEELRIHGVPSADRCTTCGSSYSINVYSSKSPTRLNSNSSLF